jgi:hypothetical protein
VTPKNANPSPAPDDAEQSKRFEDAARELEADEIGGEFGRALKAVVSPTEKQLNTKSNP